MAIVASSSPFVENALRDAAIVVAFVTQYVESGWSKGARAFAGLAPRKFGALLQWLAKRKRSRKREKEGTCVQIIRAFFFSAR